MLLRKTNVVDGALGLLDAEGLDALTTRKLGAALGVQAGALYRHFPNKQALLEAVADRILEGIAVDLPAGSWEQQGTLLANRLREALLAHRDGARVVAGAYVAAPNTVLFGNTAIGLLEGAGLPADQAGWAAVAVSNYVLGHSIEEQARAELIASGTWAEKMVALGDMTDRIATTTFDADPGERFAFGLKLLLNGIRDELRASRAAKSTRTRHAAASTAGTAQTAARKQQASRTTPPGPRAGGSN